MPGDAGYVDFLHMKVYQHAYRLKPVFEYYVMKGLVDFLADSAGGMLWIAETATGEVIGSIAIVKIDDNTAQLRWLVLDERYQGQGIGRRLIADALEFCKEQRYHLVLLWTIDFLHAARHLYESYGFRLVETKQNDEWADHTITEELWEMKLQ